VSVPPDTVMSADLWSPPKCAVRAYVSPGHTSLSNRPFCLAVTVMSLQGSIATHAAQSHILWCVEGQTGADNTLLYGSLEALLCSTQQR
jgi:hypothetical protein